MRRLVFLFLLTALLGGQSESFDFRLLELYMRAMRDAEVQRVIAERGRAKLEAAAFQERLQAVAETWSDFTTEYFHGGTFNIRKAQEFNRAVADLQSGLGWPKGKKTPRR